MAGKPVLNATKRVAYVIDHLSKNTMADIILDRIEAEVGADAPDDVILTQLQKWYDPVAYMREDKPINLIALAERWDYSEKEWREFKAAEKSL